MATPTATLVLLLILLATALRGSDADAQFITRTCNKTKSPDFCVSALQSIPRSINATTVADLAGISIDIAVSDASGTLAYIRDLADHNPGTPLEQALNLCAQIYYNAVEDLKDARDDIGSQSFDGAASSVGTAINAPEDCEGAFTDVRSPITQRNQSVKDHCGLSVDLIDILRPV